MKRTRIQLYHEIMDRVRDQDYKLIADFLLKNYKVREFGKMSLEEIEHFLANYPLPEATSSNRPIVVGKSPS